MDLGLVALNVTNRLLKTVEGPIELPIGVEFTLPRAMKETALSADSLKVMVA